MKFSTTILSKNTISNREIIKHTLTDNSISTLISMLRKICERIKKNGHNDISILTISNIDAIKLRKIIQITTSNINDIKVKIHVPENEKNYISKPKERKTDAILIANQGTSFKDTLLAVKTAIKKTEVETNIRTLRRTKDGGLLMTMAKGEPAASIIASKIKEEFSTAKIKLNNNLNENNTILHLKYLEASTDEEEIRNDICKALGNNNDPIVISNVRPGYAETLTATIKTTKEQAKILLDKKKIKVGIGTGKVEERIQILKFFKCWQYGHYTTLFNPKLLKLLLQLFKGRA